MEEVIVGGEKLVENLKNFNFEKAVEKDMSKMNNLNIIVIGKTGTGKSTLLNAVFGEELAAIGSGKPITQHCRKYSLPNSTINIYDSKGIETGMGTEEYNEFYSVINDQNNSANTNEYIHICWYCVQEVGDRLEPNEIEVIGKIQSNIPVIVTVTKSIGGAGAQKFADEIQKELSSIGNINVIPVMAQKMSKESEYGEMKIKAHGIDKLVEKSYYLLPDSVKDTFATYQKVNMELKEKKAKEIALTSAGAVAAAAFQPFPIADAPIMVAIQVAMMVRITASFGIKPSDMKFGSILSGLGGPFAAAVVGRGAVSLLKLIPGLGTLLGGAINAATGATITLAIGHIYIASISSLLKRKIKITQESLREEMERNSKDVDINKFKKEWESNKDNYSKEDAEKIKSEVEISL